MFGKIYSKTPTILFHSFSEMNTDYAKLGKSRKGSPYFWSMVSFYTSLFGVPEIGFQLRFLYLDKFLKRNLMGEAFEKILDAGNGIGAYSFYLSKLYPGAAITGFDMDAKKISTAKKLAKGLKINNVDFKVADLRKIKNKGVNYDLIINIDVLEHVDKYEKVLENFYRLLKKGGYLYLHIPCEKRRRLFSRFDNKWHEGHVHDGFPPPVIKKKLTALGFRVVKKVYTFGTWGRLAWEIHHLALIYSMVLAGILFPVLYLVTKLDLLTENKKGLAFAILAKK